MPKSLLGGSRVVISGVISRVTIIITHMKGLITPLKLPMNLQVLYPYIEYPIDPFKGTLITTHEEPPS